LQNILKNNNSIHLTKRKLSVEHPRR